MIPSLPPAGLPGLSPLAPQTQERAAPVAPAPASPMAAPASSPLANAANALSSIAGARGAVGAGLEQTGKLANLLEGFKGAMLHQQQPGETANGLMARFMQALSQVVDPSQIEEIEMVQKGNTLVVVITMDDDAKMGQRTLPSQEIGRASCRERVFPVV